LTSICYTAITFAPVQGVIEKSRKLRDLYGSSFVLSYLASQICQAAQKTLTDDGEDPVISPALIDVDRGTPNQIIIRGQFDRQQAEETFQQAWSKIVKGCQNWIEKEISTFEYSWNRDWELWANHAWEFFWATGGSISEARSNLNEIKRSRNWIGINWKGESSTLSGADAIAWPRMSEAHPKTTSMAEIEKEVEKFYKQLSEKVTEAIVTPREQLSIPELVKRLITVKDVAKEILKEEIKELPKGFADLNRHGDTDETTAEEKTEEFQDIDRQEAKQPRYSGWFQGDGDKAGDFLKQLSGKPEEASRTHEFSLNLRQWGEQLELRLPRTEKKRTIVTQDDRAIKTSVETADGRIIYAGGDDFLGALYRNAPDPALSAYDCVKWFYTFKSDIWSLHKEPITPSVGFIWAAPGVPLRDVLQHCRVAERSAKNNGRDRLAIRILFNSGNHLEWVCPWWFLTVLEDYRDREGRTGKDANWSHFYEDVAVLESRHIFDTPLPDEEKSDNFAERVIARSRLLLGLFEIYFPDRVSTLKNSEYWWEHHHQNEPRSGILGASPPKPKDPDPETSDREIDSPENCLNNWIVNLAKVGFHLHQL